MLHDNLQANMKLIDLVVVFPKELSVLEGFYQGDFKLKSIQSERKI